MESSWPRASEIINNSCDICGVNLTIKQIIKKLSLFTSYKPLFNLTRYIEKLLLSKHQKVIGRRIVRRREHKQYSLIFHTPELKNINVFQASVLSA